MHMETVLDQAGPHQSGLLKRQRIRRNPGVVSAVPVTTTAISTQKGGQRFQKGILERQTLRTSIPSTIPRLRGTATRLEVQEPRADDTGRHSSIQSSQRQGNTSSVTGLGSHSSTTLALSLQLPFTCELCYSVFNNKPLLREHLISRHNMLTANTLWKLQHLTKKDTNTLHFC